MRGLWLVVCLSIVAIAAAPRDAHAQAWVGDPGSLGLGLDYNFAKSDKVVGNDAEFDNAGTTTQQLTASVEYTPISRLAFSAALPMVALKFNGDQALFPHPGGGEYDDGKTHMTLTDLRVGARYQVLEGAIALSPHVAVSVPVADYESYGNTVAGRHLKQLHLGVGAGYVLAYKTYFHVFYEFSFVERDDRDIFTEYHNQNHTDVAVTIGHKLLDYKLDVHADVNVHRTHGGISLDDVEQNNVEMAEFLFHDTILDEDVLLVGGGVGYALTPTLGLSLSGRYFAAGTNTQKASVLAFGIGWTPLVGH